MTTALHQENRLAGSKTAPGIFFAESLNARPVLPSQVTETHLESVTYVFDFAPGCVVAPNSTPGIFEAAAGSGGTAAATGTTTGGTFVLVDRKTTANHVVTDGKGGLVVVVAPGQPAHYYTNPVINNSIKLHERRHIVDAYNFDNAIANNQPAGRTLAGTGAVYTNSEVRAYNEQLAYLNRSIQNPGNLSASQVSQVQAYQVFIQNAFDTRYPGAPGTTGNK